MLLESENQSRNDAWVRFSEVVPLMNMTQKLPPEDSDGARGCTRGLITGQNDALDACRAAYWTCALGCVRLAADEAPENLSVISVPLCLDDLSHLEDGDGYESTWRQRLRPAKLLTPQPFIGLTVSAIRSTETPVLAVEDEPIKPGLSLTVTRDWAALVELVVRCGKELIWVLVPSDLQVCSEPGFEADGVSNAVSSPARRADVIEGDVERVDVETAGWSVVSPSALMISGLLESKGA